MSRAGNPPVETIGVVDIYAPTSDPYYGLKWREPDGSRRDTSGGKTLEGAQLKAAEIDARVCSAAGPLAVTPLEAMVKQFLFEARSPYKDKKPWKGSYLDKVTEAMHRCLRTHEHYRAMDVGRALCDKMRAQAGTRTTVTQNTTALRAFLLWGQQNGYFTVAQAELLPEGAAQPAPSVLGRPMPKRRRRARRVGEHEEYVREEDAPSLAQVIALREEFAAARRLGRAGRGAEQRVRAALGRGVPADRLRRPPRRLLPDRQDAPEEGREERERPDDEEKGQEEQEEQGQVPAAHPHRLADRPGRDGR